MTREELCKVLGSRWHLIPEEIDAVLADRDFFQPYLKDALARRAELGHIPESPIDSTDSNGIFILTEMGDPEIVPDLLTCLRMSDEDLDLLYSDSLTEYMWLPFAKLGHNHLEELWNFVTDASVYLYARHAVIAGVVAMHHFHPERRSDAVAFIERLLQRSDCFPVDHLAGILCECADSGLTELTERANEFAATMKISNTKWGVMATADDVRKAFRDGFQDDFISGRSHDVYAVNKQWQRWAERKKKDEKLVFPGWLAMHKDLVERVEKAASSRLKKDEHDPIALMREQYELARQLSQIITTEERVNQLKDIAHGDIGSWLLDLPYALARFGMVREAAELGQAWGKITNRDNYLGDRAVILAEAGWKEEAHRQIEEALREFPNDVWVRIKVGDAYRALKEIDEAEHCYRHALTMSDVKYDREGALERLVPMLEELGRKEEAEALEAEEDARREEEPADSKFTEPDDAPLAPLRRTSPKIGRNDPCPCGSGKKYKKCHGM